MADAFEVQFSKLVANSLREKIPGMMEFRVGFQVLDANDEKTRACGITAFVVNDVIMYQPAFFINGKLNGLDLLYVKNNNIFCPARDNWLTIFKKQGKNAIGEGVDFASKSKDLMPDRPGSVQLRPIGLLPKTGAEQDSTSLVDQDTLVKMADNSQTAEYDYLVKIATDSAEMGRVFVNTIMTVPEFADAYFQFYTGDDLRKLAEQISTDAKVDIETKTDVTGLTIVDALDPKMADKLSDAEKKMLSRNGIFIKDDRVNFSKVFNGRLQTGVVQTPGESGIYDVLLSDGKFKTMLVLINPHDDNNCSDCAAYPRSDRGYANDWGKNKNILLIDPNDTKVFYRVDADKIFTKAPSDEGVKKFISSIGGFTASPKSLGAIASKKDFRGSILITQGMSTAYILNGKVEPAEGDVVKVGETEVEFTSKPGTLKRKLNRIIVPENCRLFLQSTDYKDKPRLGNLSCVYNDLIKQASESGLVPLTITADNTTAQLAVNGESLHLMTKTAAIRALAGELGIHGGQAQLMYNEAVRLGKSDYMLKLAAPYEDYQGFVSSFKNPPKAKAEYAVNAWLEKRPGKAKSDGILGADVIDKANKASKKGIKEVFEASALKGLLDVADVGELRKDHIVDMIRGMDKVGRTLYLFYWHNDQFEEKYGKEDILKLEDSLKQVFVKLGDLILFLKERTATSSDNPDNLFGTLSETLSD